MSRLLSEATEAELVEALHAKLPKKLFGLPVVRVSLHFNESSVDSMAHVTLGEGKVAVGCSSNANYPSKLGLPGSLWTVFGPGSNGEAAPLLDHGDSSILSSHAK